MDIAERAARLFDEVVIAVYDKPLKNLLFSPEERIELVRQTFQDHNKIRVVGYSGLTVNACHSVERAGHRARAAGVFGFRVRVPHGAGKPPPGAGYRNRLVHHARGTYLSLTPPPCGEIAALDGDVSSMVLPHVEAALKRRFAGMHDSQRPANALRD